MLRSLVPALVLALVSCATPSSPDAGCRDAGELDGADAPWLGAPWLACPPEIAPAPAPGRCDADTQACLERATSELDVRSCIADDPDPEGCEACLDEDVAFTCTSAPTGCAREYGQRACCLRDACPTADPGCLEAAAALGGTCQIAADWLACCLFDRQFLSICGVSSACFAAASP